MVTEKFDLGSWRNSLQQKTSKLEAARRLGVGKNAYNRYEEKGECPSTVKMAALWLRHKEIQDMVDEFKKGLR